MRYSQQEIFRFPTTKKNKVKSQHSTGSKLFSIISGTCQELLLASFTVTKVIIKSKLWGQLN